MPHSISPRQLIVCGFHRSGTSLTMQALKNAGLFLGNQLMPAHPSNPDGHFENRLIVSLHNEMLSAAGREWHTEGGPLTAIDRQFTLRANEIVDRYVAQSAVWGFKDPRTCLFLDWWRSVLPDSGAVLVYRNYLACYQSLRNREAQILAFNPNGSLLFWQDPHLGLRLWLDYNQALLSYVRSNPDTTVLVSCEAMLSGYDLVSAVNKKFNLSLDHTSDSGIRTSPDSNKEYRAVFSAIPEELLRDLNTTLQALNELADSAGCEQPTAMPPVQPDPVADLQQTQTMLRELDIDTASRRETRPVEPVATQAGSPGSCGTPLAGNDAESRLAQIESFGQINSKNRQLLKSWLAEYPDNVKIRVAAGRYYLAQSLYKEAASQFNHCHRLEPRNPVSLLNLGFLQNNRNHHLRAAQYFELATHLQPHNPILYFHLCNALLNARRLAPALLQCEKGLAVDSDFSPLNSVKLKILIESGSIDEARIICKQRIDCHPDEPGYYSQYAEIEALSGNRSAAMQYFYLSAWLKIKAMPGYQEELCNAISGVSMPNEAQALRRQVNAELKKLGRKIHPPLPQALH